jgi:hypothetical protein
MIEVIFIKLFYFLITSKKPKKIPQSSNDNFQLIFGSRLNLLMDVIDFLLSQCFLHMPVDKTVTMTRQILLRMMKSVDKSHLEKQLKSGLIFIDQPCDLTQWLLTLFALWTPKCQNNFHGPLKC